MMSINLAIHDKDPKRMADAAERLLSLGWPGLDDKMRRDVKEQVKALAKSLRDDGRTEEADALMARLADSEARDVYVKLTWVGEADLDMTVAEPLGGDRRVPESPDRLRRGDRQERLRDPPRGGLRLPPGLRRRLHDPRSRRSTTTRPSRSPRRPSRSSLHEGTAEEQRQTHKIDLAKPTPIVVKLTGGRRKVVLPYIAAPERPAVVEGDKEKPRPAPAPANPAQPPAAKPANIR